MSRCSSCKHNIRSRITPEIVALWVRLQEIIAAELRYDWVAAALFETVGVVVGLTNLVMGG